jgi:predicted nucleic acid-binding protein
MRYLVDTNVIVRAIHPGDPLRVFAQQALRGLRSQNHRLCILPQNVAEFWAVCTRPAGPQGNGLGLSPAIARRLIARFEPLFDLYYETPGVYRQWKRLLAVREISGRQVHDTPRVARALRVKLTIRDADDLHDG